MFPPSASRSATWSAAASDTLSMASLMTATIAASRRPLTDLPSLAATAAAASACSQRTRPRPHRAGGGRRAIDRGGARLRRRRAAGVLLHYSELADFFLRLDEADLEGPHLEQSSDSWTVSRNRASDCHSRPSRRRRSTYANSLTTDRAIRVRAMNEDSDSSGGPARRRHTRNDDLDRSYPPIEAGESPLRRWWGFADRLDRAGQISQGFTDGNQPALFTLHGLFSHFPQPLVLSQGALGRAWRGLDGGISP